MQPETEHRDAGHEDLAKLQPLRHDRLVVAIGDLAAEGGQDEIRQDENGARELDQRLGIRAGQLEHDQDDQRVLEEVVIERTEELAPEERCEPPGGHEVREHRWSLVPWRALLKPSAGGIATAAANGTQMPAPGSPRSPARAHASPPESPSGA